MADGPTAAMEAITGEAAVENFVVFVLMIVTAFLMVWLRIRSDLKARPFRERGKRFRWCFNKMMAQARAAGLTDLHATQNGLAGNAKGLAVDLDRKSPGEISGTRITIFSQPGLSLQRSRVRLPWDKGVETGDAAFDAQVRVQGSVPLARALFDAETRKAVSGVIGGRLPLGDGWEVEVEARVSENRVNIEVGRSLIVPGSTSCGGKCR